MTSLYLQDLAYIQSVGFGDLARGAARDILRRLRNATIPIRRVLDVGCGAGPLTQALTEAGFQVTGIEPSAELLRFARLAAPTAHFINASIYDVELPASDAIVAFGEALTYHDVEADADCRVSDFLKRASAAMPIAGILIFDIIECGEPPLTAKNWSSGSDWAVLVETEEDPGSRTLVRNIDTFRRVGEFYRRGHEIHRVRLFDSLAMRQELASHGFEVETAQAYGSQVLPPRRRAFFATRTT